MNAAPAGWYPDPSDAQLQRYWDGSQWTEHTAAAVATSPAAVQRAFDPYRPEFDVRSLPEETRQSYMRHQLTEFNAVGWLLLAIVTLGIFGMVHHGLKHGKLPLLKHDDPTAGKAVGFQFIPLFNLYWGFVLWPRLAQRINFQYKMRGLPEPISKDFVLGTWIMAVVGWFVVFPILAWLVMAPIAGYQIQQAANRLASGEADRQAGIAPVAEPATLPQ